MRVFHPLIFLGFVAVFFVAQASADPTPVPTATAPAAPEPTAAPIPSPAPAIHQPELTPTPAPSATTAPAHVPDNLDPIPTQNPPANANNLFSLPVHPEPPATAAPAPTPPPLHTYPSNALIPIPWHEGETLTYHVMWGIVDAADGVFYTRTQGNNWLCTLSLHSRGGVDTIYPFHDDFTTTILKSPWRSLSYTEDRHEPSRVLTDITEVNYMHLDAERVVANKQKGTIENHSFTFPYDAMDDLGSMLLHIRAFHWAVGEKHKLYVYENNSSKEGDAECEAIETRAFGDWPTQSLIKVHAVPGKGTHRRGFLTVWMTNDARRLPLHADLNFYYGTFSIDLTKFVPRSTKP